MLCFDCYDSVPVYKSMTQRSRVSRHSTRPFDPSLGLPAEIPDEPMEHLMNRGFKLAVVDYICGRVPHMLKLKPGSCSSPLARAATPL